MVKNVSPMRTAIRSQIKRLRSDARKLDAIANHLRSEAKELAAGLKADEKAEAARTNFFSKPAKVDPGLTLTPDAGELFKDQDRTGAGGSAAPGPGKEIGQMTDEDLVNGFSYPGRNIIHSKKPAP